VSQPPTGTPRRRLPTLELLALGLVVAGLGRPLVRDLVDAPVLQTWSTVFVSICVQALPFLVLGVLLSGALTAFLPPGALGRALPRSPVLSVPVASAAGVLLPGCECSSVPVSAGLMGGGMSAAPALSFMLAAPAVNPIVLVSTAVAFPALPEMVVARLLASLLVAVLVGWLWARFGLPAWLRLRDRHVDEHATRTAVMLDSVRHDIAHAGGFLVIGGLTAATLNVLVPASFLDSVAGSGFAAVLTLSVLAVVLAICSEADAFVAASLTQFSLTSRLAFLVVGPVVDVKLIALHAGTFGRGFAARFAPVVFVVAVGAAVLVGGWLL
jgi:uncharacterized membrane protein YraQ (UPF0718 family)